MARYASREEQHECPGCGTRATMREIKQFRSRCPKCEEWALTTVEASHISGKIVEIPDRWVQIHGHYEIDEESMELIRNGAITVPAADWWSDIGAIDIEGDVYG